MTQPGFLIRQAMRRSMAGARVDDPVVPQDSRPQKGQRPLRTMLGRARGLVRERGAEDLHVHVDATGRPYVCESRRCASPGIRPDEVRAGVPAR